MSVVADTAIEELVNEQMQDAAWAHLLAQYLYNMNTGFWPQDYVDLVVQKWARFSRFSIYDAYVFSVLHTRMNTGEIACVTIDIAIEPKQDKEVAFNNGVLSSLGAPFKAAFWGGKQDEDGSLSWTDEVIGQTVIATDEETQIYNVAIPPHAVPLEVGYTSSAKTLMQINMQGGLARWPYESTRIVAMVPIQEGWTMTPDERYQPTLMDYAHGLRRVR